MSISYYNQTAQKYRITLDITVQDEFNPHQIDWRKVTMKSVIKFVFFIVIGRIIVSLIY